MDYMKCMTIGDYTAQDIHYAAFARGKEKAMEQKIRRKARRNLKKELDKQFKLCYN